VIFTSNSDGTARSPISRLLWPQAAKISASTGGDLLLIIVPRAGTGKTAERAECPARARKAPTCELARESVYKITADIDGCEIGP